MVDNEHLLDESNANVSPEGATTRRFTMELPVLLTLLALTSTGTAVGNIILYRTCIHSLEHDEVECRPFLNTEKSVENHDLEREVQKYATYFQTVKSVIESICPAIVSLFLGVWSDVHGRKPLMVWPLMGLAFTSMLTVIYSMMDSLGPWWFMVTIIPFSLSGGYIIFFVAAFCHLSDVTTATNRSLRMTIMDSMTTIGVVIGGVISPYMIKLIGYVYVLLIGTTLYVVAYVYTTLLVKESLVGAQKGTLSSIFDMSLLKNLISDTFKVRPNNGRPQVLSMITISCLLVFLTYGLSGLEYMYTREKLNWALKDFSFYSAASTVITFVGSFFGVAVLQRLCGISDLVIIVFATITAAACNIIKCFATVSWHMYMATAVASLKGLSSPLLRSLLTKVLPMEEIAKIFCLGAAIEGFFPIIAPLAYNSLYAATLSTLPGAIYLFSSAINGVCIMFLGILIYYRCRASSVAYTPLGADDAYINSL